MLPAFSKLLPMMSALKQIRALLLVLTIALAALKNANSSTESKKAGLKVRATTKAFDYASQIGAAILESEVSKLKIPDQQFKITQGPGHGEASATNIRIAQFDRPTLTYNLQSPDLITFGTNGGFAKVWGDWSMWYKVLFRISGSGHFTVTASNIKFQVTGSVLLAEDGRPQVSAKGCNMNIGSIDVDVSGGFIGWLINLFSGKIEDAISANLQQLVCKEANNLLNVVANAELKTLPIEIQLNPVLTLDYRLIDTPHIHPTYLDSFQRGEISFRGQGDTPFQPADLPVVPATTSRMMYIWVSDFVVNSFLYAAHAHGLAKAVVNKDTVPELAKYLKTTCDEGEMCVGKISPKIPKLFPNATVELQIATNALPQCKASPSRVSLEGYLSVDVYAVMQNQSKLLMLAGNIHFDADLFPRINGSNLVANATIPILDVNVTKSNIGPISELELLVAVDLAKPLLIFLANEHLQRGFPIPTIQDVTYLNPQITLMDRALQVDVDVKYKFF